MRVDCRVKPDRDGFGVKLVELGARGKMP